MMTSEAVYLKPNGQVKNSGPLDYKIPGVRNIPRAIATIVVKTFSYTEEIDSFRGHHTIPL
jgi:xanthine dehydrogenase molybdopterin-binding subunit B